MALRSRLRAWWRRQVQREVDEVVAAELAPLRAAVDGLAVPEADLGRRVEVVAGTVRLATAQAAEAQSSVSALRSEAAKALQQAHSALATAESCGQGLEEVEERLEALIDRFGAVEKRLAALHTVVEELAAGLDAVESTKAPAPRPTEACRVPGCTSPPKTRGLCASHYGRWRASELEGFAGPDGVAPLADGTRWRVDPALSGSAVSRRGDGIVVDGRMVEAEPIILGR